MRPTFSQQAAIGGFSALAHLSVAGLLLALAVPPPPVPSKPLPVTVMLIPFGSAPSTAVSATAPEASGGSPVSETTPISVSAAPPLPAVALAPSKPEPKPEPQPQPQPKPKTVPKPKPKPKPKKVEPQPETKPKPTLATQPPPKPVTRSTPPTRLPKADSVMPIMLDQAAMTGPAGAATGANSGTAPAKAATGSGLRGTASDGRDVGDSQPTPAYQPKPDYPPFARRLGHEGRVVIRIQVLSSGEVAAAGIERSSGYAVLDEAALATIKRWRFRPAQRAGQPVDATLNVPITFKLQEQG